MFVYAYIHREGNLQHRCLAGDPKKNVSCSIQTEMGMTLDILKSFVYLTINFPTEERGFGSSMTASGCAMVGFGLLDSASSLSFFCDVEVPQQWPGFGMVSL